MEDLRTFVVLLGTGNPNPDPDRSGPAAAVIVDDTPYLVDFGPGVIRQVVFGHLASSLRFTR